MRKKEINTKITYRITVELNDYYYAQEETFIIDFSSVESAVNWCKNHNLKIDEETNDKYISCDGCLYVNEKYEPEYGKQYTGAYTSIEKIIIL